MNCWCCCCVKLTAAMVVLTQCSRTGELRNHDEMIDSFTLSQEAVATIKTDCKELRTTVRLVTTMSPVGKKQTTTVTKLVEQQASETGCCESDLRTLSGRSRVTNSRCKYQHEDTTNLLKVLPSVQCWGPSFSDPVPGGRRRGGDFRDLGNVLQVFSTGGLQGGGKARGGVCGRVLRERRGGGWF